jgi:ABC-2 type transport system ATP-binding protein
MSIEVSSLTKIYGEQRAIDKISFHIPQGEIVGFLGPNGAGKSTTMKILTGYLSPNEGEAKICGINVQEYALESKKKTGYLPEGNPLYYDMYVREYLDFIASVHGIDNKKSRIDEVIGMVGLKPESNKKLGQLSKGYKQRAGLAAALVHDPEVLILDEPTTGLDHNQIIEIRELIRKLGQHKTVLFSSHILQEVEAICDRVIIIHQGKLVADNKLDELQDLQEQNIVRVSFREEVNESLLRELEGVIQIRHADGNNWELETDDPDSLKKQLLELALKNNLNIVSLQSDQKKLEDIFRSLTGFLRPVDCLIS